MSKRRLVLSFLLSFILGCAIGGPVAVAKDPLLRQDVLRLLDELGVTTGGVYTLPSSGWTGTATSDLDMDDNNIIDAAGLNMTGVFELARGNDLTAAGNTSVPGGNYVSVDGATTIDTIAATGFQAGTTITLRFSAAPFVRSGQSGTGATIRLVNGTSWQTTAGDTLTLVYDGTDWREVGRTSALVSITGGGLSIVAPSDSITFQAGSATLTLVQAGTSTFGGSVVVGGDARVAGVTSATVSDQTVSWSSGSGKTLTDADCKGQTWTNTGASSLVVPFTLPDAPAVGDVVTFVCTDADGIKISANTGDTITTDAWTTASAGYVHSTRVGSKITLYRESATSWVTLDVSGTWRKDSLTVMGWAFTPTDWVALSTITSTWSSGITWSGKCRHMGNMVRVQIHGDCSGAVTAANLTFSALQCGGISLAPDESLLLAVGADSGGATIYSDAIVGWGMYCDDSTGIIRNNFACWYSPSANVWQPLVDGITTSTSVSNVAPITWANHDSIKFEGEWPVGQ